MDDEDLRLATAIGVMRHRTGQQCLSSTRRSIQQHSLQDLAGLSNGTHLACWAADSAADSSKASPKKLFHKESKMSKVYSHELCYEDGVITAVVALGWEMPKDSKISGCLMGSSMTSLISWKSNRQLHCWIVEVITEVIPPFSWRSLVIANGFARLRFPWLVDDFVCFDFPLSSRFFPRHAFTFSKRLLDLLVYTTNHFIGAIWRLLHLHQLHQRIHLKYNQVLSSPSSMVFFWLRFYPHLERWWRSVPKIVSRMCIAFHIAYGPSVHSNISHKVKGLKCCSHYHMTGPKKNREKFVDHPGPSLDLARQDLMKNIAVAGQSNARVGLTVLQVHHCITAISITRRLEVTAESPQSWCLCLCPPHIFPPVAPQELNFYTSANRNEGLFHGNSMEFRIQESTVRFSKVIKFQFQQVEWHPPLLSNLDQNLLGTLGFAMASTNSGQW